MHGGVMSGWPCLISSGRNKILYIIASRVTGFTTFTVSVFNRVCHVSYVLYTFGLLSEYSDSEG